MGMNVVAYLGGLWQVLSCNFPIFRGFNRHIKKVTLVRRTYILKRDGIQKRPLGLPGWNDKVRGKK